MGRRLESALGRFWGNQKSRKTRVLPSIGPLRSHHKLLRNSVDNDGGWLKFKQIQFTRAVHKYSGSIKENKLTIPKEVRNASISPQEVGEEW